MGRSTDTNGVIPPIPHARGRNSTLSGGDGPTFRYSARAGGMQTKGRGQRPPVPPACARNPCLTGQRCGPSPHSPTCAQSLGPFGKLPLRNASVGLRCFCPARAQRPAGRPQTLAASSRFKQQAYSSVDGRPQAVARDTPFTENCPAPPTACAFKEDRSLLRPQAQEGRGCQH